MPSKPQRSPVDHLPAFGALCSGIAQFFRLDPLALSGPQQRLWARSAHRALSILDPHQSILPEFEFFARDERSWAKRAERLALPFGRLGEVIPEPRHPNPANALPIALRDGSIIYAASSKQHPGTHPCMDPLSDALGSPDSARQFVIAHEWAHAWQHSRQFPLHEAAAAASSSPHALAARLDLDKLARRRQRAKWDPDTPHGATLQTIEESLCDAIACWSLARLGADRPFERAALFREATGGHQTQLILRAFIDVPLPESFHEFIDMAKRVAMNPATRLMNSKIPSADPATRARSFHSQPKAV